MTRIDIVRALRAEHPSAKAHDDKSWLMSDGSVIVQSGDVRFCEKADLKLAALAIECAFCDYGFFTFWLVRVRPEQVEQVKTIIKESQP